MVDRASRVKADEVPMPSFRIGELSRPLPKTKNFREYIAEDQALQDRSEREVRLHEEIYCPDPKSDPLVDELLDQLFPEKPKEKITLPIVSLPVLYQISVPQVIQDHVTTEVQTPDSLSIDQLSLEKPKEKITLPIVAYPTLYQISVPQVTEHPAITEAKASDLVVNAGPVPNQTILDFDNARAILVPLIAELQGKVTVSDFEDACKFFLETGSKDIDEVYQREKQLTKQVPLSRLQQGIAEIQARVRSGGSEAKVLQKALNLAGLDLNSLNTKADNTFSSNFAKIYFFLKELAPKEMPDGIVFDTLAKPLFEMIAERSSGDLKKPKRPDPQRIRNRNSLKQKQNVYSSQVKRYEAALAKFIPQIYYFISGKLGGSEPPLITQRLSELSN